MPVRIASPSLLAEPAAADSSIAPARILASPRGAYLEHAPLALFSLGSLAIGGAFYGINASAHRSESGFTSGNGSPISSAVGLAGLTALVAAGSYFYYSHGDAYTRGDAGRETEWDARMTGGVSADGDVTLGALLSLPLPFISR